MRPPPKPITPAAARLARATYTRFLSEGGAAGEPHGGVIPVEASGRARCRECLSIISKGDPALSFYYDFSGPHAAKVQIHARCPEAP